MPFFGPATPSVMVVARRSAAPYDGTVPAHDDVLRLYGPWKKRTPQDAAGLLAGYPGVWWVAGGWAVDAYVRTSREHGDLDIGIPRASAKTFIDFVSSRLDVWAAAGSLTPLVPGTDWRLPDGCGNLWLRASGADPWEYDVMLESVRGGRWELKRDARVSRPLPECLWERDGVAYLRPEVQLLLKAKDVRPKDDADFERCLPLLGEERRAWLAGSLAVAHPGHPWIERLA